MPKKSHHEMTMEETDMVEDTSIEDETMEASEQLEEDVDDLAVEFEKLQQKIERVERDANEQKDRALYAMAELENVKQRAKKDVQNAHAFALEKFVNALLPIIDSLDQGLQMEVNEASEAMHEGMALTRKMFIETLGKFGVVCVYPEGEPFDPHLHEAMTMQPSDEVESDHVITVFQAGYVLNDRVVRPARVIVAK